MLALFTNPTGGMDPYWMIRTYAEVWHICALLEQQMDPDPEVQRQQQLQPMRHLPRAQATVTLSEWHFLL